jgi:hypothetical protein
MICDISTPGDATEATEEDDWGNPIAGSPAATTQEDVPCFMYTRTGREYTEGTRVLATDDVMFDFLPTTEIGNGATIIFEGDFYNVEQVSKVGGGHHKTARAVRREAVNG